MTEPTEPTKENVEQVDKLMLFLAYFGIFALIPYLSIKDEDYVKWHARQGVALMLSAIGLLVGLSILGAILGSLPLIGDFLMLPFASLLAFVVCLGWAVLWVVCMIKSFGGERWEVPIVYENVVTRIP